MGHGLITFGKRRKGPEGEGEGEECQRESETEGRMKKIS